MLTGEGAVLFEGALPVRSFTVAADGRVAFAQDDAIRVISADGATRVIAIGPKWNVHEFESVLDRLLVRSNDQLLALIDGNSVIELPTDHHHPVSLAVSPDGRRIAAAMGDRTIRLWDAATGRVLDVLRGHSDLVMDVAFSPSGGELASASYDRTVRIWQLGGRHVRVLRGHASAVNHVEWPSDKRLVTGSSDGTLRVWDVPSLELPTASALTEQLARASTATIEVDRPTTAAQRPRHI